MYLAHVILVGLGLVFLLIGWWRTGVLLIGVTFVLATVARFFVPEDHVGMLAVRGRVFDMIWMGTLGTALTALAFIVPSTWP